MPQVPADPIQWGAPAGSVEVLSRRRQHAKTFRHADRRTHTSVFGGTVHYEPTPNAGGWEDVDTLFRTSGSTQVADHLPFSITRSGTNLDVVDRYTGKGIRYTLPAAGVTVSGNTISFTFSGAAWTYTVTTAGIKLSATVPTARGLQHYQFPYSRLGGAAAMTVTSDGSVQGDGFALPAPYVIGADGIRYQIGAWALSTTDLNFDWDDTALPSGAFPYVLDPTTNFSTASTQDGYTENSGASYPPAGAAAVGAESVNYGYAARSFSSGTTYFVDCFFTGWDTSSISDTATVTAATARLATWSKANSNNLTVFGDYFDFGAAIDATDHTTAAGSGGAHTGTLVTAFDTTDATNGTYNALALTGLAGINLTGSTRIRWTCSGGFTPTGSNYIAVITNEWGTNPPQLVVVWTPSSGIYAMDGQFVATSGTSATAITGTLPSAPTQDNYVVATTDCAGLVTPTATGGWVKLTPIQSTDTGSLWYKKVPAGDTALQTLTSAGTGSSWGVVMQEFGGVDLTTPVLVENNQASTTTSKASPSVSPTAGKVDALIVGGAFSDGARTWSASAFTGSNVGTVTNAGTGSRGTATAGESATLWYAIVSSTIGSYTSTVTCSAADGGGCAVAVFNPAAAAAGPPPPFRRRVIRLAA